MLSQENNEILTRVGPGTPMGNLLRRFWIPGLLEQEIVERDGAPVKLRLLGEDLVAFRSTSAKPVS
jgi:phthalate 4,5-dioxygenase oxygenase subunit